MHASPAPSRPVAPCPTRGFHASPGPGHPSSLYYGLPMLALLVPSETFLTLACVGILWCTDLMILRPQESSVAESEA